MAERTCTVDGCENRHRCKGYCDKHYQRWRKHGDPLHAQVQVSRRGTCEVDGCTSPIKARRLCCRHYQRWKNHGDPTAGEPPRIVGDDLARLLAKADTTDPDGCWLWGASINADGYGIFRYDGAMRGAHRVAYLLLAGPVPDGHEIDHLCSVRHCVNPAHMEPVTHEENVRRSSRWAA